MGLEWIGGPDSPKQKPIESNPPQADQQSDVLVHAANTDADIATEPDTKLGPQKPGDKIAPWVMEKLINERPDLYLSRDHTERK